MGWKTWNNYEEEAHKRWRNLPWRERYGLRRIFLIAAASLLVIIYVWLYR
jgi:hypothetical protein